MKNTLIILKNITPGRCRIPGTYSSTNNKILIAISIKINDRSRLCACVYRGRSLPMPDKKLKYNWLLSLNAGQSFIIKKIYNQTLDENKQQVDSLEKLIYESVSETENDQQVIQRSVVISLIGNHYQRV